MKSQFIANKHLFLLFLMFTTTMIFSQDWSGIAVPAELGNTNVTWELVDELSDSFNYETSSGSIKGATFNSKWADGYVNPWPGFGNTTWTPNNSKVTGGNLELKATSKDAASNTNYFSAAHARTEIIYPVYIETKVKIMNSVMANAVWMLSANSKEEIDIVEAYGSSYSESNNTSRDWFARRMHLSHHTFSTPSGNDYQPKDAGSYYVLPVANGKYWRDGFHRVGVYWKDPFHLEYYIDGVLVRTVSGANIIDPDKNLGENGMSSPETIIFSGAAQGWQVSNGVYPTVNELSIEADNIFKIDWIRTYKRVDANLSTKAYDVSKVVSFSSPVGNYITIKSNVDVNRVDVYQMDGRLVKSVKNISNGKKAVFVSDLSSGIYIIKVKEKSGNWYSGKMIKQ